MADLNIRSTNRNSFGAIVIGSGMSGGYAAKELCEKGVKTLVLERGRSVVHNRNYPTTNMMPWEFKHRGEIPEDIRRENPIVSRCYAFKEDAAHFFVKDSEHPYIQEKPFDWIRGYQTGGKSLLWARQVQRWSDLDFEGPARDGFAVDWPIRYRDLAPWYSEVEKFVGVAGFRDGIPHLPDGEFLPGIELTAAETHFKSVVESKYRDRHVISGRCAHITGNMEYYAKQGRTLCQQRVMCQRGCPFGGYFSANSATLPWAQRTGNLILRNDSVVHSIIYDEHKQKATGVRVIDAHSKEVTEYYAPLIFVNASALNTNLILLNSTSSRFPQGLGNDNGLLGKYIAFHNYRGRVTAEYHGLKDFTTHGRRPTSGYMPRFRNLHRQETDFLRGYAAGVHGVRPVDVNYDGVGTQLVTNLMNPGYGPWHVSSHMMGETIPKARNQVTLDPEKRDEWGMPLLRVDVDYDRNDEDMIRDYREQLAEMFDAAGFKNIQSGDDQRRPGLDIHEMGGVRMGNDPKTSLLNKYNQLHGCRNVYVTDGACMVSAGTQNPSLTYMAFAARAVDHALRNQR